MPVPQRMNFFVGGQDADPFYSNCHIGKDRNKLMNRALTPRSIDDLIRLLFDTPWPKGLGILGSGDIP